MHPKHYFTRIISMGQVNFSKIYQDQPKQTDLVELILTKVHREEKRRQTFRLITQSCCSVFFAILLFPVLAGLFTEISQSGLWQYSKMLITDYDILWSNFSLFILLIVESLPLITLIISLTIITSLVWSISNNVKSLRIVFYRPKLIA